MNTPSDTLDKSARILKRLSMSHAWEALLCVPRGHIDCREIWQECRHESDQLHAFELTYTGQIESYIGKESRQGFEWAWRPSRVALTFADQRGNNVAISIFGEYADWIDLPANEPMVIAGIPRRFGRTIYLTSPLRVPIQHYGGIWPQYRGITGSVSKASIESIVESALADPEAAHLCAQQIIQSCGGMAEHDIIAYAIPDAPSDLTVERVVLDLHRPQTHEDAQRALTAAPRIAALSVKTAAIEACARQEREETPIEIPHDLINSVVRSQPEALTSEQMICISGIATALRRKSPLVGLLSGDVGTGKTLTYLIPLITAHLTGAQCAIIAPTEILADQIAREAETRFASQGALVERVSTGATIKNPKAILVGTYGLSSVAKKAKYRPALLVCDEQHKMGVDAREAMLGPNTHLLEVSATPVPRTLASSLYGGYEIFTLTNSPVKKQIHSHLIDLTERPAATSMLREVLARGEKAAIIYPIVSADDPSLGSDGEDEAPAVTIQSVLKAAQTLETHFPGKVCVIHGGMSSAEKRSAMEAVRSNQKPLIVGSTIMETGIDIPSIAGMIVRDADRFGAAQLHQLRGRLVRNGGTGHFVMMVNDLQALPDATYDRLSIVAGTPNGFQLAEKDMLIRGFGSMADKSQSGSTNAVFRLINMTARDFLQFERSSQERSRHRD